jgi:hypothetical protein
MANAADAATATATANFWDIGTYKRCLKRIDDAGLLVDDFKSMVQERCVACIPIDCVRCASTPS